MSWRTITEADVPAWHGLVQEIEAADQLVERYSAEDLLDELVGGSWKDPQQDSLLGLDANATPRAFGHVDVRPGDTRVVRAFCWGGVHPRWRRLGIGSAVLRWQEAVARAKIAHAGKRAPARVLVHVEERLEDRRRLVSSAGFSPARWYVDMTRPLDRAHPVPVVALAPGLRLVPFAAPLSEAVRLAHNESFAEHWGSEPRAREDWEHWVVRSTFRPDWGFVVLDGDAVAGYTLASAYEHEWGALGYTCGWTDVLGVRQPWRRQGLAPALLAASMRAFTASGMQRADIGVDSENASGALRLYRRLGYVPERRTMLYVKDVPAGRGG